MLHKLINRKLGFRSLAIYVPLVLETLPDQFDSHQFIAAFAYQHQGAYVETLRMTGWEDDQPFQTINEAIVHWLGESGLVQQVGTTESENMFKQVRSAAMWKKV